MSTETIEIRFQHGQHLEVELRIPRTPTIEALLSGLPISSSAHRWGDEVYFEAPFHSALEKDARQVMDVGDVAFWPDGNAIAIFFGRTPVSHDDTPRAYSPCNMVGRVVGDSSVLKSVKEGDKLSVCLPVGHY